jgi:hypothetical protein
MRLQSLGTRIAMALAFVVAADCRLMPLPTEWSDAAPPAEGCDDRLWGHTWFAEDRLTTVSACITAEGTVREVHYASDGDLVFELETDPRLVNHANVKGRLKIEVVCQRTGALSRHRTACAGYPGPFIQPPTSGARVRVTGRYVADRGHGGHMEIHPVSFLEYLQ